ncbi:MAG: pantoate--beta-alanine ligase [Muribaculaceae bacterium]|jgi:pantoate--beta-alanine ligase|nr:pantoate--beta-alanine ligase [Muribaculaceae bacterium]MBQ1185744.1 pantoate--beta-alanine ligase [Muribaculaceae bacterium]MBQ2370674.1 pantoate--beta-alanine ligase [Muribaculaceae bacterium]MBQ2399895.1 pantoate--beta-alanine ligase [Muribaculaceae bacterium]MBQ2439752.1 pantoate--beta-alanine ligase [Muribaculaceae bacterium]
MKILRTVKDLKEFTLSLKNEGKTVGLVPTMGALHAGHISLVDRAVADNDATIVSVFVNPTQFNNPADLATYPRNEQADFELLEKANATAVFAPSVEEIYPEGESEQTHVFDLGSVAEVMEGKFRPGHFQGVAQIVSKLFRMVEPTYAYFGEKDFQQIAVIRRMAMTEGIDINIVSCPIKREDDGLAMSSRNVRLTESQRATAPGIYAALKYSLEYSQAHSVAATHDTVVERINALPECEVEYFSIVDGITLQPIEEWTDSEYIVGCITVYCGDVRLIDNITYRK